LPCPLAKESKRRVITTNISKNKANLGYSKRNARPKQPLGKETPSHEATI